MFCLESKDLIIVELYLFQKFDSTTITRLFKMPGDHEDFNSEGSNHSVSTQAESSTHFLKCWHFSSISSWSRKSLQGSLPECLSLRYFCYRRGGSNAAGVGTKLLSVGMVLSSQWGQSDSSQLFEEGSHSPFFLFIACLDSPQRTLLVC